MVPAGAINLRHFNWLGILVTDSLMRTAAHKYQRGRRLPGACLVSAICCRTSLRVTRFEGGLDPKIHDGSPKKEQVLRVNYGPPPPQTQVVLTGEDLARQPTQLFLPEPEVTSLVLTGSLESYRSHHYQKTG